MAGPPSVSPAQVAAAVATSSNGWLAPTLPQAWASFQGVIGYWLPHNLNAAHHSLAVARMRRQRG